jgi:hypothetical protein
VLDGSSCNIFFLPFLTKVELFGLGPTPYDKEPEGFRPLERLGK